MVIGDITYTNNEAEDDNIFCMTSVFVKAVLTQRNGTLNHPHAPDAHKTHPNTHSLTKRFHFTFSGPVSHEVRNYERRGEVTQGHFVKGVYALFVNQCRSTQSREINTGVRIRMSTSGTHV